VAPSVRIGLVSYTNLTSGIGVFAHELVKYLGVDSVLSVQNLVKGRERWMERQYDAGECLNRETVNRYLSKYHPDIVLFFETPFGRGLEEARERRNFRVAAIPMQETMHHKDFSWCDAIICCCKTALEKARDLDIKRAYGLFLPIGMDLFPFRKRKGHTFVHNVGYGWRTDRRQTKKVVEAFRGLPEDARLIVNAQQQFPRATVVDDSRIEYRLQSFARPEDIFAEGDISILPIAYGGYERMILESMASGMPCLTTDADPMNLFQHDERFLVKPMNSRRVTNPFLYEVDYHEVSVKALRKKMRWLLEIDTAKFSKAARAQAVAQSWESKIDYRAEWMRVLEEICE